MRWGRVAHWSVGPVLCLLMSLLVFCMSEVQVDEVRNLPPRKEQMIFPTSN